MINTKNEKFRVRSEWLVDADNKIAYRPLSFWMDYFGIEPMTKNGNTWCWTANTKSGFIGIENIGGYGLLHSEYEKHQNEIYFVGNADLDRPTLRQIYN